ncbi:MAG: PPK2 family polyphosphate kinase [Deltaproteobacteria bacterium]
MINLNKISTLPPGHLDKDDVEEKTNVIVKKIGEISRVFEADGSHALLIILQGMDGSGKDGTARIVFQDVSPSVVCSYAFKKPTPEEMSYDFLWRVHQVVPGKGKIRIFNRSHYEDVLIQRVHKWIDEDKVKKRIEAINNFETLLGFDNNTTVLKFYLHLTREKQLEKLAERMSDHEKAWKHNPDDLKESEKWEDYMKAYEDVLNQSTIPWYIVPADKQWYRNFFVASKVLETLQNMHLKYPELKSE